MSTWLATGKLAPAAIAALAANAAVYVLVMRPTRSGNSRLTKPGKSTLLIAIPAPKTVVPRNIAVNGPAERSRMPAANTSILTSSTHSKPPGQQRRDGREHPIAKSDSATSRPTPP
jgi:hypothetical protein